MHSRVPPTYKTKYRVANWASFDRALVGRGGIASVTGDAAYEVIGIYAAADARGATVVVPPIKTARVS